MVRCAGQHRADEQIYEGYWIHQCNRSSVSLGVKIQTSFITKYKWLNSQTKKKEKSKLQLDTGSANYREIDGHINKQSAAKKHELKHLNVVYTESHLGIPH